MSVLSHFGSGSEAGPDSPARLIGNGDVGPVGGGERRLDGCELLSDNLHCGAILPACEEKEERSDEQKVVSYKTSTDERNESRKDQYMQSWLRSSRPSLLSAAVASLQPSRPREDQDKQSSLHSSFPALPLPLLLVFTNADHDLESGVDSKLGLGGNSLVGLPLAELLGVAVESSTALRVAKDDPRAADFGEHGSGSLTSVGAKRLDTGVLPGDLNVGTEGGANDGEVRHGHTNDNINIVRDGTGSVEGLDKSCHAIEGEVALRARSGATNRRLLVIWGEQHATVASFLPLLVAHFASLQVDDIIAPPPPLVVGIEGVFQATRPSPRPPHPPSPSSSLR